jgi:hypothetical protein
MPAKIAESRVCDEEHRGANAGSAASIAIAGGGKIAEAGSSTRKSWHNSFEFYERLFPSSL